MSILRHSFHVITKQFSYFLLIAAVLITLTIGAVYWLSDAVEQRQDEIATWVGDKLGYPVKIGSAGLNWLGLVPKLQLENVIVFKHKNGAELLSLQHLYFGLDLLPSIKKREPVLNDITLTGLNIAVIRDGFGQLRLQGLNENTQPATDIVELLSWVQLLNRIHLQEITVNYTDQQYSSLSGQYKVSNATVLHKEQRWTTTTNINFPSAVGNSVQFNAQGLLDENDWQNSVWQWQAKLNDINLASLSDQLIWQDIAIKQGMLNANLSGNGIGGQIEAVKTELVLEQGELISHQPGLVFTPVSIEQLAGKFDWRSQAQQWQLIGQEIQLHINGDSWPQTAFTLSRKEDSSLLIESDYLRLSDITSIALLTSKSPEIIRHQQPAGDVEKFSLHYSEDLGISSLAFNLADGALLPWDNYAGVTGLTAIVDWKDDHGSLNLNSHELTLYPEQWLDDAIFFDSVSGMISLQKTPQSWRVKSNAFRVWNDDLTMQLDGNIEYTAEGKAINDLKLTLEEIVVDRWQEYLPKNVLNSDFKAWSDKAFQAGKIVDGVIELQGDLADFPYKDAANGRFNMALTVEDVHLHYAPKWPDLFGVTGTITSSGNDLIIKSKQGKVAGFNFDDVTTTIANLATSKPILRVSGDIKGTTVQAIEFLQNSPLKQRFGGVASDVIASGASDINLNLMVPLADVNATEVSGYVSFIESQMQTEAFPELVLSQINGLLHFTHQSVSADMIEAQLLSEPVTIAVRPDGEQAIVSAKGHIARNTLNDIWPSNLFDTISGKTAYQMDMIISEKELGDFSVDVIVNSNLRGLEFDFPEPLYKASEDKKSFQIGFEHREDSLVYSIEYDDLFNAIVMPDDNLWRGEVRFGLGKAQLPEHGLKIRGQLAEIAVDDWLQWIQQQAGEVDTSSTNIDDISMTIDKLTAFNQELTGLNLSAQRDAQGWRTKIHSDQTKGSLYLPADFNSSSVLMVDLDKLEFSLAENELDEPESSGYSSHTLWPAMDIKIGSLTINDMALGKLRVQARRKPNSWTLDLATLTSDIFTASIPVGKWQQLPAGDQSHFELQADSMDLAALLANFGYQQAIDAESVSVTANLSWADMPLNISRANIKGLLDFDVGKGQLEDIEPGAAGRIFGLLSVAALPRRLALDFSDLFGKGFSFDSVTGTFDLANGQAVTDNLILEGTTAKIEITGPVDLINKQYNQQVKVTPDVSSTLPVAGAVGGPVGIGVGTAILIVDKIVDKIFNKDIVNFISYRYHLTGSWDDPQLNVVKPAVAR
ncbi:MAG: YhdP family protein [Methylophagaceae bacterium]